MATKQKTTAILVNSTNTKSSELPNVRLVQNFHLVWLDRNIDEVNNGDWRNSIAKLRQAVKNVNRFTDADECIDFITDNQEQKSFMVVSGVFSQTIVPIVQNISQIISIYIFCENEMQYAKSTQQWPKVKGVYTNIAPICEALGQTAQECDQNSVSISFIKAPVGTLRADLDQLDSSFMYTQILKEILLTIDFEQEHINEFLRYCREQFVDNISELKTVDKIQKEYHYHQPIWWYTSHCFLYSMLNRVLRLMEVDLIIKMGFFLRDLHKHITTLYIEQYGAKTHSNSFFVYRGQGLTQTDFDQLKKTNGGLLSFNNFLSTSLDRAVSLAFAESNQYDPDLTGVLFEITINPAISSSPFANVRNVSYYLGEEEILFSMHSVFRIGEVRQIDGHSRLWQVELTLTSENDPQLYAVTESMRKEIRGPTEWHRLGQLMITLGQFDKAEELYEILLRQTSNEYEKAHLYHMLGMVKDGQGNYTEAARFYKNSMKIGRRIFPPTHPDLAASYNNIGRVYNNMSEHSKALSYYKKALEISQKTLAANHPHVASSYNNIGAVYGSMDEYSTALSYYEKALEIYQKTLPANHSFLATSYNNIAGVYGNLGEYSKALSYYEKAFEILQKTLPTNHPYLATSYNNIGRVYNNMGEHSKALSYYKKDLEISRKTLAANHPHFATSYNNIGGVKYSIGEYWKALSYYEKALKISRKTVAGNHPHLANSYNNIASVYHNIGEYRKALFYYEKALEIREKSLPPHNSFLAASYNNIGKMGYSMGEYSKALSYYEKGIEIEQKSLPANHPHLATSYNNIGLVYDKMADYSKALSYYEKALQILQKTLPANHPYLAISYNNIGLVYYKINKYSKALFYYEKALEILQKTLSTDHPHLATSYNSIGAVFYKMRKYSKALSYCEHALDMRERSLPSNHPSIKHVRRDIEIVKKKL